MAISSGSINEFVYGIGNIRNEYSGANSTSRLNNITLNLYDGQYSSATDKVYGKIEYNSDINTYTLRFYADSDRIYQIAQYSSGERSGSNITIIGSGVGVGMSGVLDYSLG